MNCVSHVILLFVRQIKTTYLLKLDAPRAFTRVSYRNINRTLQVSNTVKTNKRIRTFNTRVKHTYLLFKLLR